VYILDTDPLGLLQRQRGPDYERLATKIASLDQTDVYVTIVSFHEQINGWTKYVKGSHDSAKIVTGYLRLERIIQDFAAAQVLPFSIAASEVFDDLKSKKVRVSTMDLRIASIAQRMTVVTRNTVDFGRIPNLLIEDWAS